MSNSHSKEGRPRVAFALPIGLGAMLLAGCATMAHSGPAFHRMSTAEHLQAACELDERAKTLEKKFDAKSRQTVRPGMAGYGARAMNVTSSTGSPDHINPTYRFLVMARDLRILAQRHLAAAGRPSATDRDICSIAGNDFRSYGGSLFWW